MNLKSLQRTLLLLCTLVLGGCAASQMHGFQNAYQGYNVPESLVEQIRVELKKVGLADAQVTRDNVGRIRLVGSYRNEDEVDRAYIIVQSLVGLKSTSPFYPDNIQEKRWEARAKQVLTEFTSRTSRNPSTGPGVRRALIVGINTFQDKKLTPINGEDDARVVQKETEKAGFKTITLLGPQATKANIEGAIERLRRELGTNDSLLIYISSHGNQPIRKPGITIDARKMSIAAYDSGDASMTKSNLDWGLKVQETSVSDELVQNLAKLPVRLTRVIIDTCYSGEILKDIPDESQRYILKTNGGMPEYTGISMAAWTGDAYAAKGIVFSSDDGRSASAPSASKDRRQVAAAPQAIADMNRYSVITATSDGQLSWGPTGGEFDSPVMPNKRLKGSFFTQAFFEYLNQYNGQLEPAFAAAKDYTYKKVSTIPPPSGWKGPVPIQQLPRLNPPLPANDPSTIYN